MIHSTGIKQPIYKDNIDNFTLLLIKEKNGERICIGWSSSNPFGGKEHVLGA